MADVTPASSSTSTAPAASAGAVAPVEAAVSGAPEKLQQLTRQIQVTGTVAQAPDASTVVIDTATGKWALLLPALAAEQKQKLIQQLTALFQSQKTLTILVQPGNPPTQAFLLLPNAQGPAGTSSPQPAAAPPPSGPSVSLAPGAALSAVALPPGLSLATTTAASNPSAASPSWPTTFGSFPASLLMPPTSASGDDASLAALLLTNAALAKAEAQATAATARLPGLLLSSASPDTAVPHAQTSATPSPAPSAPATAASTASPVSSPPPTVFATSQTPPPPPASSAATAAPPSPLFPPGQNVSLRVIAVLPPNAPPPAPATGQIAATVIGNGPGGQLLLKANDTDFYVRQNVTATPGSTLVLTADAVPDATPALLASALPADGPDANPLQQVMTALAQISPHLAQQVFSARMPQPNGQLSGTLLFFLNSLRQGNMRGWLGENAADALARAGKATLLAQLAEHMAPSGLPAHDPVAGEWRAYSVPLHYDGQFHPFPLYVRREASKQDDARANVAPAASQVRFLIDIRMSRLGAMQLDGLVQPKKLDMVLRSEAKLPPALPNELRESYARLLEALGYQGGLSFQTGRQHWLTPRRDDAKAAMVT